MSNSIYQALFPFYLVLGVGFVAGKLFPLDKETLVKLLLFILLPALFFDGTYAHRLTGDDFQVGAIFLLASLGALLLAYPLVLLFRVPPGAGRNLVYFASFASNCANFAIPVLLFLRGKQVMGTVSFIILINSLLINSLGVFLLTLQHKAVWGSLRAILKNPLPYAILLGVLANLCGLKLPGRVEDTLSLLGQAAIPLMIILLGLYLAEISLRGIQWRSVLAASLVKLLIMPALALLLMIFFKISLGQVTSVVLLVEAAAPVALISIVLASYYQALPRQMAAIVLVSSLLVWLTLPLFV